MLKGLFLSLPSVSVNQTLLPVITGIATGDYRIIYYNTEEFRPSAPVNYTFKAYPPYADGYDTDRFGTGMSFFRFAEALCDTADSLADFLLEEVERERPDFILHSHL